MQILWKEYFPLLQFLPVQEEHWHGFKTGMRITLVAIVIVPQLT